VVTHINETGEDHDIHFKPSWPPVIVHVHPANSYGARFPALPKLPSTYLDTRVLWSLLAMTCLVSEIWEHVSRSVESTKDWQGWILHFATQKCVIACSGRGSKNNPFSKLHTHESLIEEYFGTKVYNPADLLSLFSKIEAVKVCKMSHLRSTRDISDNQNVLFLFKAVYEKHTTTSVLQNSVIMNNATWELRLIVVTTNAASSTSSWKGRIFSRHGNHAFLKWWKQE